MTQTGQHNKSGDRKLVLVTGLAGAGSSTALNILEDIGFLAVDNLPLALVSQLIGLEVETAGRKVAVSIDGRTSGFDPKSLATLISDTHALVMGSCWSFSQRHAMSFTGVITRRGGCIR